MPSATLWVDIVRLGRKAARHFKLTSRRIVFEPIMPRPGLAADGGCHKHGPLGSQLPHIYLRVFRVNRPRSPLRRSTIMASLAHELAHLRHDDHLAPHGELTRQIAAWLKEQGQPVGHVLHGNTGKSFLPAHLKSKKMNKRRFRRAWKRPKPRGER